MPCQDPLSCAERVPVRTQLAGYLARARGVVAEPKRMVIVSGAAQGLALLARVLVRRGTPRIAVEDPSLPIHRLVLERQGAELVPIGVDEDAAEKLLDDMGTDVIGQHALARLIETRGYDRHLRVLRRRHRNRRDALVAAVARHLPEARVSGIAAGLHANVVLREAVDVPAFEAACERRGVRLYGSQPTMLFLGYANLAEAAVEEGLRRVAGALAECRSGAGAMPARG